MREQGVARTAGTPVARPTLTRIAPGLDISHTLERQRQFERYQPKLVVNADLTRSLVSFQSNKGTPFYRWFRFKEGFSSEFVGSMLQRFGPTDPRDACVIDPFAGSGTTLTTAARAGWNAIGIELLPVGTAAMRARLLADSVDLREFGRELARLNAVDLSKLPGDYRFPHLRITRGAFPRRTEQTLSGFHRFLSEISDDDVRYIFWFACLTALEDVSYTRKDGQYLRWDRRAGRNARSSFDKGSIHELQPTLLAKLAVILEDLETRNGGSFSRRVQIRNGSCFDELPMIPNAVAHLILTSPPYCNRYDYTRTYALELAFMEHSESHVRQLRQQLLSATVENKSKREQLQSAYADRRQSSRYRSAASVFDAHPALQEVLVLLQQARAAGVLNNQNIPCMVENYFFEMNLVIRELARVLVPGGHVVMVNDNVQYQGEEVPVDLILSDFAEASGLRVEVIWMLPKGKGNSSQQMGAHGRNELRKCVYVWSKPV